MSFVTVPDLKYLRLQSRALRRDVSSMLKHGRVAPRFAERIWINPSSVKRAALSPSLRYGQSAHVRDGDWDTETIEISAWDKLRCLENHWIDGTPWTASGIYELMLHEIERNGSIDGCSSLKELEHRYSALDRIFAQVKHEQALRSTSELGDRTTFRGSGDMLVHIGRGPSLLMGRGGQHRFAIARILDIPLVPAQIGVVHTDSLSTWSSFVIRSHNRPTEESE